MVLFIKLYKVVLGLESVDETLKCDNSTESYLAMLACGLSCPTRWVQHLEPVDETPNI